MSQLITISSSDDRLNSYLDGSFSNSSKAVLVQTLRAKKGLRNFIFKIISDDQIVAPPKYLIWLSAVRWSYLSLCVAPILATGTFLWSKDLTVNFEVAISGFLVALFLQLSANLFSEYLDHVKGHDGENIVRGSQVIQKGWLKALELRSAGYLCLSIAVALGFYTCFLVQEMFLFGGITAVSVLAYSSKKIGLKYWKFGPLVLFLLAGPVLSVSYGWAISSEFLIETFLIGVIFGVLALQILNLKNLQELYENSILKRKTISIALGFDDFKNVISALFVVPIGVLIFWVLMFDVLWSHLVSFGLISALLSAISWRVFKIPSFLSSKAGEARNLGLILHFICSLFLSIGFIVSNYFNV